MGEMTAMNIEKAEVFNEFFASILTASQASHTSHAPESLGRGQRKQNPSTVIADLVTDCNSETNSIL